MKHDYYLNLSRSLFLFLSLSLILSSCSQDEIKVEKEPTKTHLLSEEQINEIGQIHNDVILDMIKNIDLTANKSEIQNQLETAYAKQNFPEINEKQKKEIFSKYSSLNIPEIRAKQGKNIQPYLNKVDQVLANYRNHNDIVKGFNTIALEAKQDLEGLELEKVLIMLSVGKHSTQLWLPQEKGGLGDGFALLKATKGQSFAFNSFKATGEEIFWHDMLGALEGAVGWAATMAIAGGPVTLSAYLVTLGVGAAISSVKAAY